MLDASLCGDSWTEWQEREGTFGVAGDVDWFRFDLEGCSPGLLEAEVIFDPTGLSDEAARKIQAAVAMVRVHEPSPCEQDAECLGKHGAKMGGVVLVTEISKWRTMRVGECPRVADVVRYKCRGRSTHLRLRMTTASP